jgi:hypothetical protein
LKGSVKIVFAVLLNLCLLLQNGTAQDTLALSRPARARFKADPFKATMLAVALPGFGQIYNRKYWKIPLVYAGFGGIIYAIAYNANEYNIYMKAYQDFTDNNPKTTSYLKIMKNVDISTLYDPANEAWYSQQMLSGIDYYKRYRDLSYIGIVAWYLVTILDANVDASLFNYDISNDLAVKVEPVMMPLTGQAGVNVGLRFTF